jgi:hypothetical protein
MTMLSRLFPRQIDNRFDGYRAALWLLGLLIALKLVVSVNSIVNTQAVAVGADGFPLDRFGPEAARAVLMLFALSALGQLVLAMIGVVALIRYRAMVPLLYLLSIGEMLARRLLIQSYAVERSGDSPIGAYMTYGILALLVLGLLLSLIPRRRGSTRTTESDST